jgi:hypothetical protein
MNRFRQTTHMVSKTCGVIVASLVFFATLFVSGRDFLRIFHKL